MTPEQGRWIMFFGGMAWFTHAGKLVAFYLLLWRTRRNDKKGPFQMLAFLFLIAILVLLPYQDRKASKAMNRFLMVATILQYLSLLGLAYIILILGRR